MYLIGLLSIIYLCIEYRQDKSDYQQTNTTAYYIDGGFSSISSDDTKDTIYANEYFNDTLISDVKVASNIAYVIMKEHFKEDYFKSNNDFKIYSVNKDLWALFNNSSKLLLLMQKSNCKILYINSGE